MKCGKCNTEIGDKVYGGTYCKNCWWELQEKPQLIITPRLDDLAPNWKGGVYKGRETEYHREYARENIIYNKFTHSMDIYNGEPCSDGLVRHHEYYDLLDINAGIVFITQSEHMFIHQAIRFKKLPPIPVYANWRLYDIEVN